MRKLLVAAALAALSLPLAVPVAVAHTSGDHKVEWGTQPKATARDGIDVSDTDELVTAVASMKDGVASWDVVIRPSLAGAEPTTCHEDVAGAPQTVYINCPWDTTRAVRQTVSSGPNDVSRPEYERSWQKADLGPAVNGKYTIEITVSNTGNQTCGLLTLTCSQLAKEPHALYQDAANKRWREVFVVNGVAEPTGLLRSFDSGTRKVTLTWNRNPEPDIEKYVVQEKVGSGIFKKVGEVPASSLSFERDITRAETYQYRVAAFRPSARPSETSSFATTEPIEVTDVTPPPTTASGSAATPEEEPGVTILGPPESTTTTGPETDRGKTGAPTFSGGLIPRPSNTARSAPSRSTTPTTEFDPGFTQTLPYKPPAPAQEAPEGEGPLAGGDGEEAQTFTRYVTVPRPRDARALLIPLAGGLTLFVFAMQVTHVVRRRPEVVTGDDFGDWDL